MSKTGTNNVAAKQENNTFKKDSRGSSGNTSSMKEDKRSDYTSPSSQGRGRSHHDHNDGRNRDRSGGRHDSRHYDKSTSDTKSNDREDKTSSDPSSGVFGEKKFTGRCRLFVGNLTPDVTEEEFRKMFEAYGEISEVYVNTSRGFGFIRLDYRHNAESAKAALDGLQRKGRILRVRFATHGAALKVKNLHPFVSNELLEQSFSQFGDLERCVVIVDDKGKPTGEGIVEFVRKPGANSALRRITEGVFLIGADPKPVAVEPLEHKDEEDGMPEKFLTRTEQYKKEREKEPRFAPPGTFEYEFGMRWKQVEELEKQRIEQVKKDTEEARLKLEDEMQNALYDYQAEQIRQELVRQQEELRRLEELRNADRLRRQQEHELRRQQDDRERAQQEERRRADAMMMMRQQDLARGRGPLDVLGLRGADDFMMGDRYGDRMGDRMPDRLGDRMPDRMSDRMGPGQPGFMWDEKQRGEAVMRGDTGRGRGSGAPSGQPPSVPPSAVGTGERGGPAASAAGGAAQGAKSSPKPLMQGSGFGNVGSAPGGGGPGSGPPSQADANAMDEGSSVEIDTTQILTTEEWPPDGVSSEPNIETDVLQQDSNFWPCTSQAETESLHADVDLLGAHADHRSENGYMCADNSCLSSSDQSFDYSSDGYKQNMSDHDLELPDAADRSDINSSPVGTCQVSEEVMQTTLLKSFSENVDDSLPHFISHMSEPHDDDRLKSTGSVLDCSDNGTKVPSHSSQDSEESDVCETMRDLNSEEVSVTCTMSANSGSFSADSHCGETLDADTDSHLLESSAVCNDDSAFSRDTGSSRLPVIVHSDDSNHTLDNSWYTNHQAEITEQNCETKQSAGQHETASLVPVTCTATSSSECFSQHSAEAADDVAAEQSECPTQELSLVLSSSFNQNSSLELYRHSLTGVHQLKVSTDELESEVSCKQTTENEGDDASFEQAGVSSYMQHIPVGAEEMDVEVLQEATHASAGPDVCESLEDVKSGVTEAGEGQVSAVSVNGDNLTSEVQQSEDPLSGSSQVPKSDTSDSLSASTSAQIASDDAASSVEDQVTPSSASPSLSSQPAEANCGDQDRLFAQGDQAFISTAARQPSSVPFMPPGCSLPYVPGIGPSMYGGPAIVPGMQRPTVLTSSSVHIAQHPGGATIMQHQSMSTGLSGGMAHASVVQQQAMPNGVQSTSVLQRTLTNGGQTMVVQQRTMTTGLDGVTQQTVVQQQMAAPAITPAALFHANAMRQRTLMQQRGIRFIRTGVPVMHAQTLGGASLIPGAAVASAPLLGHGLLRGVSQGAMMQQLVRQRYLGGPVMPGRGVQFMAGRPIRVKMTYPRESMPMDT